MKLLPWSLRVALLILSISGVMEVILSYFVYYNQTRTPIQYQFSIYTPLRPDLCPGDLLIFDTRVNIDTAPIIVRVVDSFWSVDGDYTAVFGRSSQWSIIDKPTEVSKTLQIQIPLLPPGRYEYRRAAQDDSRPPSIIAVPFQIRPDCAATLTPTPTVPPVQPPQVGKQ